MSSEEEISLSRQVEQPPRSLALMLKNQYVSKELNDIFSATEIREHEIVGLMGVFSARFVTWVMSTTEEDKIGLKDEELKSVEERLAIKRRLLSDPNAMAFAIVDSSTYAFGLCRQSLKRQSRREAMQISMSPRPMAPVTELGLKDKLFANLGVSKKYRKEYVEV